MVNLPPNQPNQPSQPAPRRTGGSSPPGGGSQIRDLDELLAVVLAVLGIGSVLGWSLTRNPGLLAESGILRRSPEDAAAVSPTPAEQAERFEPRTFDPADRPERVVPDNTVRSPGWGSEDQRSPVIIPSGPAPTPAASTVIPSGPAPRAAATTQTADISDVPTTHWAYPFIKSMFDQGYLPDFPDSGFQPDQPLTRAELAALISQAFGDAPREGSVLAFTDVPDTYWAAPAIANAVNQNFMNGYPEGDFRPEQAVPRYEVLVSLVTGLNLPASPAPEQTLQSFVDAGPVPEWARPKVAAATENGLVVNHPSRDQLKPAQAATRAEIVAMIHQALVQRGELPAVNSEYAVPGF
ncbi:MAG TPA: S-layer homology domain-containing protein [Nodosilinea sp.]|nr:S-layer homology domain-containing protein [Nodosilinea sp.]